jgi:hypothetical protein
VLTRRTIVAATAAAALVRPARGFPRSGGSGIDPRPPTAISFGTVWRYNDCYSASSLAVWLSSDLGRRYKLYGISMFYPTV